MKKKQSSGIRLADTENTVADVDMCSAPTPTAA